jgi:hypothetical protein
LEFEWADLFAPDRRVPGWFVEHPHRSILRTLPSTWIRSFWPGHFWARIGLAIRSRRGRLVLYVATILLASHLILSAGSAWSAYVNSKWPFLTPAPSLLSLSREDICNTCAPIAVWPYRLGDWALYAGGSIWWDRAGCIYPIQRTTVGWFLLGDLLMPLVFLLLPETLRRCRVRKMHLLRGVAYSLGPLPLIMGLVVVAHLVDFTYHWQWARWLLALDEFVPGLPSRYNVPSLLMGVWLVWFWWRFVRSYLRLPRPEAVAAAMLTIAGLTSLICSIMWYVFRIVAWGGLQGSLDQGGFRIIY